MQLQTHLVRRKSHFYFRTRIPTDLKSHYGKTEIIISLKTCIELKPRNSNNQSKDTTVSDVNNSTDTVQNVYNIVNTVFSLAGIAPHVCFVLSHAETAMPSYK